MLLAAKIEKQLRLWRRLACALRDGRDSRYATHTIDRLLARGRKAWRRIVLDFDGTDDPTHGAQQLSMFRGYYDHHMYHPLVVFDGEGWPVAIVLRPGNTGASAGAISGE